MQALVRNLPQSEPYNNKQVPNSAGGYTWKVTPIQQFKRFLILGSEKGTYYNSEFKLTQENINNIRSLLNNINHVQEALNIIEEYAENNTVKKMDYLLFALAMFTDPSKNNRTIVIRAYEIMTRACKIPTHLFMFIEFCKFIHNRWGPRHRNAIKMWYNMKENDKLAFLMTKYQNRNGWSHRDVLRLAHIKPKDNTQNLIFNYAVKGALNPEFEDKNSSTYKFLNAVTRVKDENIPLNDLLNLVKEYKLQREHIPNKWFNESALWRQLLPNMGITALLRNLNKLTSVGLFNDVKILNDTYNKIMNNDTPIHPLNVLLALKTYSSGHGALGNLSWEPNQRIVDALDTAFYKSFKFVSPTNKRFMLALDVSGSMTWNISNASNLNCIEAAIALSMVTHAIEPMCHIYGFSSGFIPLKLSSKRRLDDNLKEVGNMPFDATDAAQPMLYALKNKIEIDTFIVYTDSETWFGKIHPYQALLNYRKKMKIPNAKLIVVAMTSNGFTIANPDDPGMLDVVGFNPALPEIMKSFIMEEF